MIKLIRRLFQRQGCDLQSSELLQMDVVSNYVLLKKGEKYSFAGRNYYSNLIIGVAFYLNGNPVEKANGQLSVTGKFTKDNKSVAIDALDFSKDIQKRFDSAYDLVDVSVDSLTNADTVKVFFIQNNNAASGGGSLQLLKFKGEYNATTNDPHIENGKGEAGDYYFTTVGGSNNPTGKLLKVNDVIAYNGTVWQSLGNLVIKGPKGDKGDIGDTGPIGPTGKDGPAGKDGATGPEGKQGPIGPQGPKGEQGPEGKQGKDGPTGKDGQQGPQGPVGPKGDTGATGKDGPQGPEGKQGPKGDKGADGTGQSVIFDAQVVKEILQGSNVELKIVNSQLTISSTGGGGKEYKADLPLKLNNDTFGLMFDTEFFEIFDPKKSLKIANETAFLRKFLEKEPEVGSLTLSQGFIDILNDAFDEVNARVDVVETAVNEAKDTAGQALNLANEAKTTAIDAKNTANSAKATADIALATANKAVQKITVKNTATVTGKATPDGKGGVELEFEATGGGGSSDKLIAKVGTTSATNALYGTCENGLTRLQGLDYSGSQSYVVDVKNMTKIVGIGTKQGADLVGNYFGLREGGKLVCWQTINTKYSNKLLSAEATIASNVKSFDVNTTQSVDGKSTVIAVAYVNEFGNIDLLLKDIDNTTGKVNTTGATSEVKPSDHNLKIFVNDDGVAGSTLKHFFHIIHWNVSKGGAYSVAFDLKNLKFLEDKVTKIVSTGNGGPFVLGNTPKYGVLTAPAINKRVVILYSSAIGVISSVDKTTNVVKNEIANINYDPVNNCMLFTYLNGTDGLDSTLSNQAEIDMWTTDRQSNLIRQSDPVILNFWAINETADKKFNGSLVMGIVGQYLWTIRNPNGQISLITFSTASDYRIYPRCEDVLDYFLPKDAPPCMVKHSNDLVTILAINSSRATQAYFGCDMPTVGPNNFLGQAVDNSGTIAFKGKFGFSGVTLEVGKRYYVDFVGNGKYNISTNPKSGICVGLAINASTTIF